jgi:hypothetical protein
MIKAKLKYIIMLLLILLIFVTIHFCARLFRYYSSVTSLENHGFRFFYRYSILGKLNPKFQSVYQVGVGFDKNNTQKKHLYKLRDINYHRIFVHDAYLNSQDIMYILSSSELIGLEIIVSDIDIISCENIILPRHLNELKISYCNIDSSFLERLIFPDRCELKSINLSGNPITSRGIEYIINHTYNTIESISVRDTMVNCDVLNMLKKCKHLTYLDLTRCDLHMCQINKLCQSLSLKELVLGGTNISDLELIKICDILDNKGIKSVVYIDYNDKSRENLILYINDHYQYVSVNQ